MASSSIVPAFCYLTNIDVHMLAAVLEILGCFIYQDRTFILFNKVQLYKVPECAACAISICLRGFHRSAANAFQELQFLNWHHLTSAQLLDKKMERSFLGMKIILLH